MSCLPADRDTKKFPASEPSLILTVSESSPNLPLILSKNLTVYAETVDLESSLTAPFSVNAYKVIQLSLYTYDLNHLRQDLSLSIDLSAPGSQSDAESGKNGSMIKLYIENATIDNFSVPLKARGGKGFNGRQSQPGTNGGNGGSIEIFFRSSYGRAIATVADIIESYGSKSGNWRRSLEELSTLYDTHSELKNADMGKKRVDEIRASASSGEKQKTISLLQKLGHRLSIAESWVIAQATKSIDVKGGVYGLGGRGVDGIRASDGSIGEDGTLLVTPYSGSQDQCNWTVPLAHPVQCRMLLEKAKLQYWIGGQDGLANALRYLRRLDDRLAFVDNINDISPIRETYARSSPAMFISDPHGNGQSAIDGLKAVRSETTTFLEQLQSGRDFYGTSLLQVPRASYQTYMSSSIQADEIWKSLKILEQAYTAYLIADKDYTTKASQIKNTVKVCTERKKANDDRIAILKNEMELYLVKIKAYSDPIATQKSRLIKSLEECKQDVRDASSIPTPDVLDAIGQCLFAPGAAMKILQGVNIMYSAQTQIPSDDGRTKIDKKYLLRKIQLVTGSDKTALKANLKEAHKSLADGNSISNDAEWDVLLLAEDDMNKLMEEYSDAIGDSVKHVKDDFRQFSAIMLERNSKISHYDACVKLVVKYEEENRTLAAQAVEFSQKQLDQDTINFPAVTAFMESMYLAGLSDVMWQMYQAQRALQFATLKRDDIIAQTLGDEPLSQLDYATLSGARAKIVKAYLAAIEAQGQPVQVFKAKKYHLSPANLYLIRQGLSITEVIPPVIPATPANEHPLHGLGNVRLTKVRFYAIGATTTSGMLFTRIEHGGDETMVRHDGSTIDFKHSHVSLNFCYMIEDPKYRGDDTIEGDIGDTVKGDFALVGPFASWTIEISQHQNEGLDLSDVTEAYLEFEGQFEGF